MPKIKKSTPSATKQYEGVLVAKNSKPTNNQKAVKVTILKQGLGLVIKMQPTDDIPAKAEKGKKIPFPAAMKILTDTLKKDKEYRETWAANITMSFYDHYRRFKNKSGKQKLSNQDVHKVATDAAEYFIKLLCDELEFPEGR